jgi:hypothetical protein
VHGKGLLGHNLKILRSKNFYKYFPAGEIKKAAVHDAPAAMDFWFKNKKPQTVSGLRPCSYLI